MYLTSPAAGKYTHTKWSRRTRAQNSQNVDPTHGGNLFSVLIQLIPGFGGGGFSTSYIHARLKGGMIPTPPLRNEY